MDLFEAKVQVEVEKRMRDIVKNNPEIVIEAYQKENELLKKTNLKIEQQLIEASTKVSKWEKFLDSEGYLDVSEIADKIKVPYINPSGKREQMGLVYFCQLLTYDKILLPKSTGYALHRSCSKVLHENSKNVSTEKNGFIRTSVKFNAKALEWLDNKYSNDNRVWRSTTGREIYYE